MKLIFSKIVTLWLTFALSLSNLSAAELNILWMGWPEEVVKPLMDDFMQANPDVSVNVEKIPFAQIFQTTEVRLAPRNADPDVYILDHALTSSYAIRGHLLDLSEVLDEERFTAAAVAAASYQGKMYSAPFGSSSQIIYYNKDLFEAAAVEPPPASVDERWTWQQVVEAAQKIRNPEQDIWGLIISQPARPYQLLPLAQSKGASAIDDSGFISSGHIDSAKFIEAFEFYQKLFNEYDISPRGQFQINLSRELFNIGKAGMLIDATSNMLTLETQYPDVNWGVAPHPYFADGKPVTPTGAWHMGINPRSDELDAAKRFVRHFMSDGIQQHWLRIRPYVPVLRSMWQLEADYFAKQADAWRIIQYELENTAVPRPPIPGWREYEDILRQAIQDINTGANVAERLQQAAVTIDREMQKYKQ